MSPEVPESSPTDNHKVMQSGTEDAPNLFDSVKQTLEAISSEYSEYPADEVRFGPPPLGDRLPLIDSSPESCQSLLDYCLDPPTHDPYGGFGPRRENGV
jgi:hypothetical protein